MSRCIVSAGGFCCGKSEKSDHVFTTWASVGEPATVRAGLAMFFLRTVAVRVLQEGASFSEQCGCWCFWLWCYIYTSYILK